MLTSMHDLFDRLLDSNTQSIATRFFKEKICVSYAMIT